MSGQPVLDQRIQRSGIILMSVAFLLFATTILSSHDSKWLLELPLKINAWSLSETPNSDTTLGRLNYPKMREFQYQNPLDEIIFGQLIAPHSYEAYRELDDFQMLEISGQRSMPILGSDKPVRAWILKVPRAEGRILLYTWLQTPQGTTYLPVGRGLRQSFMERLKINGSTFFQKEPKCLVRLWMFISPSDKDGIQARRSMDEIARGLYQNNTTGAKK